MPQVEKIIQTKSFANTYLYNKGGAYEKHIFEFLMKADQINKLDESFGDIRTDIKRRAISNTLVKILDSDQVVLLMQAKPLPKAFKIICAKDPKSQKHERKIFIDCSGLITYTNGSYKCYNPDILVAYLVTAMNNFTYYMRPKEILLRDEITKTCSDMFAVLFTNIINYIYKINTISSTRAKCLFLSSMYCQTSMLGKDITDSTRHTASKISGLSDREQDILLMQTDDSSFTNIKEFVETVADTLNLPKLTLELVLEKWVYLYGTGTQFGLELYTSFAEMITNAYVGCYINNQKTIEKLVGKDMNTFTKAILAMGGSV